MYTILRFTTQIENRYFEIIVNGIYNNFDFIMNNWQPINNDIFENHKFTFNFYFYRFYFCF